MRAQIYVRMKALNGFEISFFGLKEGKHRFEYKIEKEFFEYFKYDEFVDANLNVGLDFHKKSTLLELHFLVEGTSKVNCDVSNEPFDLPLEGNLDLVVKFGEEYNDDNEEVLIIPHGDHKLNVAQYIYEMVVLSVPSKKVHPGIEDGSLDSEILKKLEELSPERNKNIENTDPRWDDLKKLIDKN